MTLAATHDDLFDLVPTTDSKNDAIIIKNLTKRFALFNRPEDRLKQMVVPNLQRLVRAQPAAYFKEFSAVTDVSLTIGKGETIGIIGRNGSGKSTLLQMIVGTLTPTSGSVKVNGRIAALLELGAGFNPEFTGRENVYVNGSILGFSRAEMDERFESIAAFAGIGDFIERPVKTYSSGMFIRLAFAVATAVEPDILVVDEALSVGDEAFQRKCFARIEAIKERGGTILFVSHGAQTIVQLCDRAVLLDGGAKILEGRPKTVVSQYQRLINANGTDMPKIRSSIQTMNGWIDSSESATQQYEPVTTANIASDDAEDDNTSHLEFLDLSLTSPLATSYEKSGAKVAKFVIYSANGNVVNTIVIGKAYRIGIEIEILDDTDSIEIGHHYSTKEGLHIGGRYVTSAEFPRLKKIYKGTLVSLSFNFVCRFAPGVYFASCGIIGSLSSGERKYMDRKIDVLAFRVVNFDPVYYGGYFDFQFSPSISFNTLEAEAGPE